MERSAGAIIKNKYGKYLVIKGRNGFWGFPKGHIEIGESEKEAAKREVNEEVGLDVKIQECKTFSYIYSLENGEQKEVTFFLAEAEDGDIRTNREIQDCKWLEHDEVLRTISFDETLEAFKRLVTAT